MPYLSYPILLVGGFIAGLYGSSVGSGGLVSLPTLLLIGFPTQAAIATNRLAAVFGEGSSVLQFRRHRKLNTKIALPITITSVIGAFIGAQVVLSIPTDVLNLLFAGMMVLLLPVLLSKKFLEEQGDGQPKHSMVILCGGAFLLGLYNGFFGVGFGTFATIALAYEGLSLIQSAAIARFVGFFASIASLLTFAAFGTVNFVEGTVLGIGFALGAWIGVSVSLKRGNGYIRLLLIVVVLASVAKLLGQVLL